MWAHVKTKALDNKPVTSRNWRHYKVFDAETMGNGVSVASNLPYRRDEMTLDLSRRGR